MGKFSSFPHIAYIPPDFKMFKVKGDFEYYADDGKVVAVLQGFVSDGASIPQFAWSIIGARWGKYGWAAVIHDWTYKFRLYSRLECDKIFLWAMRDLGVGWLRRTTMYNFCRWFAWIGWNVHKDREPEGGEIE